jgi:hypothetical protein
VQEFGGKRICIECKTVFFALNECTAKRTAYDRASIGSKSRTAMDYLQSVVKTASMKGGDEIMLEQVIELLPVLSSEDK